MTDSSEHLALESLLDTEREAICDGRLQDLAALVASKENLLRRLPNSSMPSPQTLKRLKEKADRNQLLLGAVVKGVRSVSARIAAIRHPTGVLNTYSASGSREPVGGDKIKDLERRA